MPPEPDPAVGPATAPEDIAAVEGLFRLYLRFVEDFLGASLDFQGTEREFATFPATYDALFLARLDGKAVGACGVKPFDPGRCELKRLFVRPEGRGHALGRRLTEAAIRDARGRGYTAMLLDTNPGLLHANRIYEALGFRDIPAYYPNPLGEASRYMALDL